MADKPDIDASQSEDESYSDQEVDVPVLPKSTDPSCCATGPKKTVICVILIQKYNIISLIHINLQHCSISTTTLTGYRRKSPLPVSSL